MGSAGVVSGKSVFGVLPASRPTRGLRESRGMPGKVFFFGGKLGSCGVIGDLRGGLRSGFGDEGHVRYYSDGGARCVVEDGCGKKKKKGEEGKKRMKLLVGLSRDLAMFMEMGFGVDGDDDVDQGKKISESAETLLKHLELLKAEQKELKRNKKEEKTKQKAERMKDIIQSESSSSSSESSDSECGEVVDMSLLKESFTKQLQEEPQALVDEEVLSSNLSMAKENSASRGSAEVLSDNMDQLAPRTPIIEVCMGNKCKKSGSIELLAEFERMVGLEGAVVGCKCLGKCRDGPNVRVLNSFEENQAESVVADDSVRTPANPICIGVGLEDVGVIVANFLAKDRDLGFNAAAA